MFNVLRREYLPVVHSEGDDVTVFLNEVKDHNFSQSLVQSGEGALSLVTTNSIARWFAQEYVAGDGAVVPQGSLGEVLQHSEPGDVLEVHTRKLTVVEAWRIFAGAPRREPPMAIVLTENGKRIETPLALHTRSDVPEMLRSLLT